MDTLYGFFLYGRNIFKGLMKKVISALHQSYVNVISPKTRIGKYPNTCHRIAQFQTMLDQPSQNNEVFNLLNIAN